VRFTMIRSWVLALEDFSSKKIYMFTRKMAYSFASLTSLTHSTGRDSSSLASKAGGFLQASRKARFAR
jgi:hypothetical protein